MTKTAVFTVVYPKMEPYLPDFLLSLDCQTNRDFDVVVVNDGLDDSCIKSGNNTKILRPVGSIAGNRQIGIEYLVDKYECVIFADSDDFPHRRRVEIVTRMLVENDVVVNDLDIVNSKGINTETNYLSHRYRNKQRLCKKDIEDYNLSGFSNTAVRTSCLKNIRFSLDVIAVDWYLFAQILGMKFKAIFTNSTVSYYRQHGDNIAGFHEQNAQEILCNVNVKKQHYKALAQFNNEYRSRSEAFSQLYDQLSHSESVLTEYVKIVRKFAPDYPLWWETARFVGDL